MKKRFALILISIDECFPKNGFSGGAHKVTQRLIQKLVKSEKFEIDIYCKKGELNKNIEGISSINILGKKDFIKKLKNKLCDKKYDYILSSDVLLPFANNLIHSHSSMYKSKNGKKPLCRFILRIYNSIKIHKQASLFPKDKSIFTVSKGLKKDLTENFNIDENKVFVAYPATETPSEFVAPTQNKTFTIGAIAGGGINKGGYLLLLALRKLKNESNIKARLIFPKINKSKLFRTIAKIFGLSDMIELVPQQENMSEFFKTIDCYVLPSLNEAFGLVVTEAAMNFKPTIVSSTAGARELIKDGENGFVFDRIHCPTKTLATKISDVKNLYFNEFDKFSEVSKNAHAITKNLSWEDFGETILNNIVSED